MKAKHLFMGLFMLVLCFFVLPETVSAENAPTSLFVNGEEITAKEDYTVTCGSGSAVYDPSTATLTLNNAYIDKTGPKINYAAIDTANDDCHLTICLVGNNTIATERNGVHSSSGSVTFSGTGKLSVTTENYDTINVANDITIDGPELILTSAASGMCADGTVMVCNGANVTVKGKDFGIYCGSDLIIKENSTVVATTTNTDANAVASWGNITVENSSLTASGTNTAIFANDDMNISNSTVSSNAEVSAVAIYVYTGNLLIEKGSKVDVKAGYGLFANTMTIDNSNVEAESTNTSFAGIRTKSTLKITGNSDVIAIGKIGSATGSFTVSPAQDKMIEVKTGTSENTAAHLQNSPFEEATVISNVTDSYYHSKPHVPQNFPEPSSCPKIRS